MTTARGKGNRGVKGRRVIYGGDEWTVAYVTPGGALGLTREHRNRTWTTGDIPRDHVKFVRHDYTAKETSERVAKMTLSEFGAEIRKARRALVRRLRA